MVLYRTDSRDRNFSSFTSHVIIYKDNSVRGSNLMMK